MVRSTVTECFNQNTSHGLFSLTSHTVKVLSPQLYFTYSQKYTVHNIVTGSLARGLFFLSVYQQHLFSTSLGLLASFGDIAVNVQSLMCLQHTLKPGAGAKFPTRLKHTAQTLNELTKTPIQCPFDNWYSLTGKRESKQTQEAERLMVTDLLLHMTADREWVSTIGGGGSVGGFEEAVKCYVNVIKALLLKSHVYWMKKGQNLAVLCKSLRQVYIFTVS